MSAEGRARFAPLLPHLARLDPDAFFAFVAERTVEARGMIDEDAMKSEAICLFGLLALSRLRTGQRPGAYEAADRALWHIRSMRPVAYWLQPALAGVAEVFLTLEEEDWAPVEGVRGSVRGRGRQALAAAKLFARHVSLGRPWALIWRGLATWLDGRHAEARGHWQRAIVLAERVGTAYERARAHFEIGRHMSLHEEERSFHLNQAAEQFERLGSLADWRGARAELDRLGDALRGDA